MKWTGWLVTALAGSALWFGGGGVLSNLNILEVSKNEWGYMLVGVLVVTILCIGTHIVCVMIREYRADDD